MNIHLQPLSFRKYSLILIYSFFIMAVIAWCMEFYFERLYGDLTRIGNFPERSFGWQSPQPAIAPELFKDYPLTEADILVIGDSFSVSRVWQSKLIADGLKVGTMTWQELRTKDEVLPSDLGVALRAAGFKGRYLIIESIERLFQQRMESLAKEHPPITKRDLIINADFPLYPFTKRKSISLEKLNGADWGVKTLYNSIKLALNLPEKYLKSGAVQAINFQGCELFSHRLCRYAIFVDGDFKKKTFNSIDNVLAINKNLQSVNIQAIWMVVPDKSTVYLGYGEHNTYPYQNIWQKFAEYPDITAPNLGTAFVQKSRTVKDFYMPNDTHLSTNGFLYLGEFMTRGLRNLQTNQAKPFSQ
jgi:hypothetical protein